jgi:hypothetical protein
MEEVNSQLSIYSTPISSFTTADVQELLDDQAVENARLEFKREVPGKDETLKKLSSFANTFGGVLVIGAEAGSDGRIVGLPGVAPKPGYKQTVIQWCTTGSSPPLTVEVSDPIPASTGNQDVCYVISIAESELAPHFLNGRKGVYVRTDEFSNRFEPHLAIENELRHLLNRRQIIRERRNSLIQRAHDRFQTFCSQQPSDAGRGVTLLPVFITLTLVPRYPAIPASEHTSLLKLLRQTSVPWRGTGFPMDLSGVISQHESAIALGPCGRLSFLEANTWGMLSYATSIAERGGRFEGIHVSQFLGYILVFLEHARVTMHAQGLAATLRIDLVLQGVRGVPWVQFPRGFAETGAHSVLDDTVAISITSTTDALNNGRDQLARELLRYVFFAINWPGTADDAQKLDNLVLAGYQFNGWRP